MTPQAHDLLLRVAEAVRAAAATAARGDADIDARAGRNDAARYHEGAAFQVRRIDIAAIVAQMTEQAPDRSSDEAFANAAREALFSTSRREDGTFYSPLTERAYRLWHAAIRWARVNPDDRSPAPQHKAGEGVAAD